VYSLFKSLYHRGKKAVEVDFKNPDDIKYVQGLIGQADVVLDPYRPGVLDSKGLGAEFALQRNPSIVYARLVGFPRDGERKKEAGHDINYLALSGVLSVYPYLRLM
jgi:alpha-methylacyl-CoA racemase